MKLDINRKKFDKIMIKFNIFCSKIYKNKNGIDITKDVCIFKKSIKSGIPYEFLYNNVKFKKVGTTRILILELLGIL